MSITSSKSNNTCGITIITITIEVPIPDPELGARNI